MGLYQIIHSVPANDIIHCQVIAAVMVHGIFLLGIMQTYIRGSQISSVVIGASVSEPPLVDSTDALSRYIYRRAYVHRYCACAALRANEIWNRFSPAESAFSACIRIESDQLSQHYDDHLGLQTTGRRAFPASAR